MHNKIARTPNHEEIVRFLHLHSFCPLSKINIETVYNPVPSASMRL